MSKLDSKIPAGPLADKWKNHKAHMNLVAPNNRDKIDIIVVETGFSWWFCCGNSCRARI